MSPATKKNMPCYHCGNLVAVEVDLEPNGRISKWINIENGAERIEYPWSVSNLFCRVCIPVIREKVKAEFPKCGFCKTLISSSRVALKDKNGIFCSSSCADAHASAEDLSSSALREKQIAWAAGNPQPDYPAIFTREGSGEDKLILALVRSLNREALNGFFDALHIKLREITWAVAKSHADGSFYWAPAVELADPRRKNPRLFTKEEIREANIKNSGVEKAFTITLDMSSRGQITTKRLNLPLPICIWEWIQEGADPLSF